MTRTGDLRTRARVLATAVALPMVGVVAVGCGGGSKKDDPAPARLDLTPGAPPSAAQCGFDSIGDAARDGSGSTTPPKAGAYSYSTTGRETTEDGGTAPLAQTTTAIVTPTRRTGGLTCFGSERRLSTRTELADVYLLRGEDIYLVGLGVATPNLVETIAPRPAILALSGSQSSWTGAFRGNTAGTYKVELLGRRTFRVGGKSVKTVGLDSRATFTGETTGSQKRTTWIATDQALIVQETGRFELKLGGSVERLAYSSRLESLEPGGAG
jgi:hypothetical protein